MLVSVALFSGLTRLSTVPGGNAANASFVGAKTVNGPAPFSVSTRPAALTAATSVVWSAEFTALSTMSFVGYIACPPTTTVSPAAKALDMAIDNATAEQRVEIFIADLLKMQRVIALP